MSLLEARAICKSYGAIRANDDISFRVDSGEVVGLVGENGAGKSTLLAILAGFLAPDSGTIVVEGAPRSFRSPADALAAGIGLVHQHLSLVPTLTVWEQLRLAGYRGHTLPSILGTDIDREALVEQLSLGRRQRLEIARVLVSKPRLLLLDEPTSILAPVEVETLFATLREIRRQGTAVVIVSHKLREILQIADRVIVLARGRVTGAFDRTGNAWSPDAGPEILARMFARSQEVEPVLATPPGPARMSATEPAPILVASGIATEARAGGRPLRGIDLVLLPGTIHVVVGVDGQGQSELAEALAGYRLCRGRIELNGEAIDGWSAEERARSGIGLLAEDRIGEAGIGEMSIMDNLVLKRPRPGHLVRHGTFRRAALRDHARRLIAAWEILPADPTAPFATLSGGNMQRVVAAREIDRNPRVLVALNPVQGLDARTSATMWDRLRGLAAAGSAVLAFINDLDEALAHADQVATIFNGTLTPMAPVTALSRDTIARNMVGE